MKEKDSSSFLARIHSVESHGLFVDNNPSNFLFTSLKVFFPCYKGTYTWLVMVGYHELQFSADPE